MSVLGSGCAVPVYQPAPCRHHMVVCYILVCAEDHSHSLW